MKQFRKKLNLCFRPFWILSSLMKRLLITKKDKNLINEAISFYLSLFESKDDVSSLERKINSILSRVFCFSNQVELILNETEKTLTVVQSKGEIL